MRRDLSLFSGCPNFCSYAELMEVALMRTLSVLATGTYRSTYSHCSSREIKHRVYSKQQTREFVPHDQVFHLLNLLLLFIITA